MQQEFMLRAFELAKKANPCPNPKVGCIIVKDNKIIGEGFHKIAGKNHAEIEALNDARQKGNDAEGAEMYVTLEPCSHHGRTPPCTKEIISSGIKKVYIGIKDHNYVAKGGISELQKAGIKTELVMDNYANEFYKHYTTFIRKRRPFVTLKVAMTLDGMIAGKEKQISCHESMIKAHELRSEHDAILIGVGTLLADDPLLNVRLVKGNDPVKVVLDSNARTPDNANIFKTGKTIIFTNKEAHAKHLESKAEIIKLESLEIKKVLEALYEKGFHSVMVEGGQKISTSFIISKLVDELILVIAPKTFGEGLRWTTSDSKFLIKEVEKSGVDLIVKAFIE